jgi:quercetin dioxygenase-like cupin family protein
MENIEIKYKNGGHSFHIANGLYRTIISGKDTDGTYAMIEMNVPPGGGPGPHAHRDIEEVFYVASGEVDFCTENGVHKAKAGDTIRIPKGGAVHAFRNTYDSDATLICTVHPAGLEQMFAEINASDPFNAKVIAEEFGNQFFPDDYFDRKNTQTF